MFRRSPRVPAPRGRTLRTPSKPSELPAQAMRIAECAIGASKLNACRHRDRSLDISRHPRSSWIDPRTDIHVRTLGRIRGSNRTPMASRCCGTVHRSASWMVSVYVEASVLAHRRPQRKSPKRPGRWRASCGTMTASGALRPVRARVLAFQRLNLCQLLSGPRPGRYGPTGALREPLGQHHPQARRTLAKL